MTQAEHKFDRMVRVERDLYRRLAVQSAMEERHIKEITAEALRAYLATRQTPVPTLRLTDPSAPYTSDSGEK